MLTDAQLEQYERDGYLVVENFITLEKCQELLNEIQKIIKDALAEDSNIPIVSYNGDAEILKSAQYFMKAYDKIRLFLEGAVELNKADNVEKIAYAVHALNPLFKELTFSSRVKDICKQLKYKRPFVCQSQIIMKRAYTGGEILIHQDATSLHVNPDERKVFGLWIPLQDATVDNGCVEFIPGSHKGKLARKLIRNPDKEAFAAGKYLIYDEPLPEYDLQSFVPAQAKAGSLVLIDGLVVHKSAKNSSAKSRNIYTWHIYENEEDGKSWSPDNWLTYSPISHLPVFD